MNECVRNVLQIDRQRLLDSTLEPKILQSSITFRLQNTIAWNVRIPFSSARLRDGTAQKNEILSYPRAPIRGSDTCRGKGPVDVAIEEGDDWLLSSRLKTVPTVAGREASKIASGAGPSPRRPRAFFLEAGAIDRERKEGEGPAR